METVFATIEKYIPQTDIINASVSKKSVGWQLDHALNVIIAISENIATSNPKNYKPNYSFLKSFILTTGYMPRGKGKAPKFTIGNKEQYSIEYLTDKLLKTKQLCNVIPSLDKNSYFKHPLFGHLNRDTTLRFLKIHSKHHFKIIEDILANLN